MTWGMEKNPPMEASKKYDVYSTSDWDEQRDHGPVVLVPTNKLLAADSPRLAGEDIDHVRLLAESKAMLPPIVVDPSSMRVIDGMHRLRAAELRGEEQVEVRFFGGDERDSFVFSVRANIAHGLPLSLADRTAAAARIIRSHPQWSDRAIAATVGLAAKTVGAIRRRSTEENPQLNAPRLNAPQLNAPQLNGRVGRDGKVRPRSAAEGRKVASKLLTSKPDAPLREVANAAGISLGTAQNVRARLRRGESPVLSERHAPEPDGSASISEPVSEESAGRSQPADRSQSAIAEESSAVDRALLLRNVRRNPDIRFTDAGRVLIRLLQALDVDKQEWDRLLSGVPEHCTPMVSAAARACAQAWQEFAEGLERR